MPDGVVVLLGLGAGTYAFKAAGPMLLGGRTLPPAIDAAATWVPAALLASLVVVSTVVDGSDVVVDARIAGVGAAAVALARRAPFVVVVAIAVAVTALVRQLA